MTFVTTVVALLLVSCAGDDAEPRAEPVQPDASTDRSEPLDDAAVEPQEASTEDAEPHCLPATCAQLGASCGSVPDGCGGKLLCGQCPDGQTCGGGGTNKCGTDSCIPKSCVQLGASCGYVSDGCSEALDCGTCPAPLTCGGGGIENQCGCKPKTCMQLGASCGSTPDGCGGVLECGDCPAGQTCGGGGTNKCGTDSCMAKTCAQLGASCGYISDGCNQALDCGECTEPEVCGGAGLANQCGCTPKTCAQLGASCGTADGGCGPIDCGPCPNGEQCGGGGVPNQCGCSCQVPHATTICVNGGCAIETCDPGWRDCNGEVSDGCEVNVDSNMDNCGGCGVPCTASGEPQCSTATCVQGVCETIALTGNACDDGNACTLGDTCNAAGLCVPGATPVSCTNPPSQCYEPSGTCNPADGTCHYTPRSAGASCNADNNACTQNDWCDGSGTCVAGSVKQCDSPPNTQCWNPSGTCNPSDGTCQYTPRSQGTSCNADNNACTQNDSCNGSGTCVAGPAKQCNSPPNTQCWNATGTCDSSTGQCNYSQKPNGTTCGNACRYCSNGSCLVRGDGYQYDTVASHRCCGGSPVDISSNTSHCGGCFAQCASGKTCQSVSVTTSCASHPANTSGRCTCSSNSQCPVGRDGEHQVCRTWTPYPGVCTPDSSGDCAANQVFQDLSGCPNYCRY